MSILGGIAGNLAGGSIGRAVVSLVLDTTGYNAQLEKTQVETTAATSEMQGATSRFSGVAVAAYAIAATAAVAFAKSAIDAASEHEQVVAALTAQVGDNTQAFEEQATALQHLSGFQDEAILQADTILSRYKLTDEQVRSTIPTILDYARATGKTVPDAAGQVGKALLGNTRALKAVGISYTSTGNAAEDFNNILGLLNAKVGGQAAAYADTYAGKIEILAAKFDDLKESVGVTLIAELSQVADDINIITAAVDKLNFSIGDSADNKVPGLLDVFNPLGLALDKGSQALSWLDEKFGITDESAGALTDSLGTTVDAASLMADGAYEAATATAALAKAQAGLLDAVKSAGEGILSLTTTVKDTFDISEKELRTGFAQMLKTALRFEADMKALNNLDIGLSPNAQARFETFMTTMGPGYIDRFVNSSAAAQDRMVAKWERTVDAINTSTAGIKDRTVTIAVDTSVADRNISRLEDRLSRVGL